MGGRAFGIWAALVVLAYPLVGLYPYRWDPPRMARNTAGPGPEGGLRMAPPGPGIARSGGPPEWVEAAMRAQRLRVDLRVRPASLDQHGPARILTLSRDPSVRNFTVAQDGADLIIRIRTPWHTFNGAPQIRVPNVFHAGRWVDIRVRAEPGSIRIEVDGAVRVSDALPPNPLGNWDPSYRLALGNELTGDRPWLGDIGRAVIRTAGTKLDYAAPGALEFPSRLWYFHNPPALAPFRGVLLSDAAVNLFGFIPLGVVLGIAARRRGRRAPWRALFLVAGASLTLELLQLCVPDRYPSVNDLILNTLGGGLGLYLGRRTFAKAQFRI